MDVFRLYEMSLLSQMTYADGLTSGLTGSDLANKISLSLVDDGVTDAQAQYFAGNYKVIYQQPTTGSGFSATLFQDIETNEHLFSIRGTDTSFLGTDWTDANLDNALRGVSRNQVVDMLNFYLQLITPTSETVQQYKYEEIYLPIGASPPDQPYTILSQSPNLITYGVLSVKSTVAGLGLIDDNQLMTVTGHSLGGHLASAFTLLFPCVFSSSGFIRCVIPLENNQNQFIFKPELSAVGLKNHPRGCVRERVMSVAVTSGVRL